MFGWGYKEDALKWREYQKELDDAELAKTATMTCKVHLIDGDVVDHVISATGKDCGYWKTTHLGELYVSRVVPAEMRIDWAYGDILSAVVKTGFNTENTFYPTSQIKRIERGEVKVTQ